MVPFFSMNVIVTLTNDTSVLML
uniref:Uncharacterized protein n=1 Tax=Lepeophtheirus salmonis TaxID=72036 RepID=A0A0K2TBH1_LEPSM